MKKFALFFVIVLVIGFPKIYAQTGNPNQRTDETKEKLQQLSVRFQEKQDKQKAEVLNAARQNGWEIRKEFEDGKIIEIMKIGNNGMPQSFTTTNLNAARTVNTDDLWSGGSSGLNLDGSGYLIGEWDGGGIRLTHQEFDGRVTQIDAPAATSAHSTHVAGTIIGQGQVSSAHGMANAATLNAYDWDTDITEMTTAASSGLTLSNHSYAWNRGWTLDGNWYWFGDVSISTTEDYLFGFYDENCEDLDILANNAPSYLMIWAAANDRNDNHTGGHYYWNGSAWTYSTAYRDPDGGADGYDCLPQNGCAKNVLTIGAVDDITGGWTSPADVVMSTFSSWGPTDDGRIKPDIVANGVGLYSTDDDADNDYTTMDGTSMAAPSTTGTLALLQDYYLSLRGGTMSATSIKGLVINTANEAGTSNGPDYQFGHGLLNATGAAELITADDAEGGLIVEAVIKDGQNIYYRYYSDGTEDISVTLCWNDPAHAPITPALNPTTATLVHDLDLYIIDPSSSYRYPWRLNPASPSSPATNTSYNYRDNVERTDIYSPAAGYYKILIDEFSTLPAGGQSYSLIIKGLQTEPTLLTYCDARSTYKDEHIVNVTMGSINNNSGFSPGGYANYTGQIDEVSKGGSKTISVTIGDYFSTSDVTYAYLDWNHDGDFVDAGESYYLGNTATVTSTITVPTSALYGYTTMRVRMVYGTGAPCGTSSYSEAEDYTIKVTTPGLWTGEVNADWANTSNWDDGIVPTSTVDVTIPAGCPNYPNLTGSLGINTATYTFDCKSLLIQSGGSLAVNGNPLYNLGVLTVAGNLDIGDDFFLNSGSTVNLSGTISIGNTTGWHGQAYHNAGSIFNQTAGHYYAESIVLANGSQFNGTGGITHIYVHDFASNNNIEIDDPDSYFYRLNIESTANAALYNCSYDLDVTYSTYLYGALNVGTFVMNSTYMDVYNTMTLGSGGTVNVTSNGPYIHSGGTLSMVAGALMNSAGNIQFQSGSAENISGGEIYIEENFYDFGNYFSPTGGSVIFDGSSTTTVFGPTVFYDLIVNKTAKDNSVNPISIVEKANADSGVKESFDPESSVYDAANSTKSEKATIVYLGSGVTVNNDATIQNGELILNGYQLTVNNIFHVYGTLTMNNAADVLDVGTNSYDNLTFYNGSTSTLIAGSIYPASWVWSQAGATVNSTNGNTIYFTGSNTSGIEVDGPGSIFGNVDINKTGGTMFLFCYASPAELAGFFNIHAGNAIQMQGSSMIVHGVVTDNSTSTIHLDTSDKGEINQAVNAGNELTPAKNGAKGGSLIIDPDLTINGLWNVLSGSVLLHGGLSIASSGILNITTGSFIADKPYYTADAWQNLYGTINLSSGLFEITHNSMRFGSTSVNNITGGTVRCGFTFYATDANIYKPAGGVTEFTGNDPNCYIRCENGNWFNNFTVAKGTMIELNSDITVKGHVNIVSGPLNTMSISAVQYNMYVGGNWNNTSGEAVFNEGSGTVFFNGVGPVPTGNQYITGNETFYNLENAKSGGGNLFFDGAITISNNFLANDENIVNGPTLTINNLLLSTGILGMTTGAPDVTVTNFTMGGYLSVTDGNFTCYDVTNNGIFGTIDLYNGSVTLYQDALQYADLNATLNIQGGYMAVNGGNGGSLWGFGAPCNITMSNGVLDFSNNGIYIDNTYPLTENITGGTIKTNLTFYSSHVNFTPSGGTLEMYGGSDAMLSSFNNSSLYNLLINKSGGDKDFSFESFAAAKKAEAVSKSISGAETLSSGNSDRPKFPDGDSKSNTIYTSNIVKVNGTTTVEEGTFLVDNYQTTCMNNIIVNSGGKLAIGDFGTLAIENGKSLTVNNSGFLDLTGSAGGAATITHNTGYYILNIESGATIGAVYGTFEYMNTTGVNIKTGSLVDNMKPFSYCTFRNGQSGGTLLTVNNNQTFYVENAVFPTNSWTGASNVTKTVNAGMVYFIAATGGFAGESNDNDSFNRIMWNNRSLSLKAFLEGPFNGSTMNTTLNGILPISHPYNVTLPYFGGTPEWYYTGAGSVAAIPNVNIVDWVLVDLRDATSAVAATPAASIARFPAFILNNGTIVGLNGSSNIEFTNTITNNLYVVIFHRNHQSIMSANPLPYTTGVYTYDYSTGAAQVYGGSAGHKLLGSGIWGMRSGDGNGNGDILLNDKTQVWGISTQLGKTGYLPSDFNFDRQTNNKDKNDKWLPNNNTYSQVPN